MASGTLDAIRGSLPDLQGRAPGEGEPPDTDPAPGGPQAAGPRGPVRGGGRTANDARDPDGETRRPLLDRARLTERCELVKSQADSLLSRILEEVDRFEAAAGEDYEPGVLYVVERNIATLIRQATRAHACLIPPDDRRYNAARQVIGYCDDADADPMQSHALPPAEIAA